MRPILLGTAVFVGGAVIVLGTPQVPCTEDGSKTIEHRITHCPIPANERANFKAQAIAKANHQATYQTGDLRIEIQSLTAIENGVEVFVRAWRNNQQLGFGDGSVEIERIRIYNPPVLVPDSNGSIVREETDLKGNVHTRKLREDHVEAIRQTVAHTVSIIGMEGTNIQSGKVGNTTSTFHPDPNPETNTVDGWVYIDGTSANSWASLVGASTGTAVDTSTSAASYHGMVNRDSSDIREILRGMYLFNTATLTDTDTINSAVFAIYVTTKQNQDGGAGRDQINVFSASPASNTDLVTADFDQVGSVAFSTEKDISAEIVTGDFNEFTLNATGLATVTTTGVSKFSTRIGNDYNNNLPGATNRINEVRGYQADRAGTTEDPKLVVTHTAAAAPASIESDVVFFE